MRTRLLLISLCVAGVLAGCGADDGDGGAKQSKVSADAYPAVQKFVASDVKLADYGSVCDDLEEAKEDRVAAASEPTCRKVVELTTELNSDTNSFKDCDDPGCIADKAEPALRNYLTTFGATLRSHNRALADALEPGACLTALQTPEADLDKLETSLRHLGAAVKRFRGGDTDALNGLFEGSNFGVPDPAPCKP